MWSTWHRLLVAQARAGSLVRAAQRCRWFWNPPARLSTVISNYCFATFSGLALVRWDGKEKNNPEQPGALRFPVCVPASVPVACADGLPAAGRELRLLQTLHARGHIRHQPEPVAGVCASKNPHRFICSRAFKIFRRAEWIRATITLVANLGCKQIFRRLLGRNTLHRRRDDQDLYANDADGPHIAQPQYVA